MSVDGSSLEINANFFQRIFCFAVLFVRRSVLNVSDRAGAADDDESYDLHNQSRPP
jgi:hypothetical protein